MKILLGQEDPNQAARQLHYYAYLYHAHIDLIRQLRQDLDSLQNIAHDTQDQQKTLAKIKADQTIQSSLGWFNQMARSGMSRCRDAALALALMLTGSRQPLCWGKPGG